MKKGKKVLKRVMIFVLVTVLSVAGVVLWVLYGSKTSNPHRYATLGDIPVPSGYERISGDDASYTTFLRLLPLKEKGTQVDLYTGGKADMQSLNYAVVDMPLLSNYEQCADVCMRLRAEYLFRSGQYGKIHFKDVNGKTMAYKGGASRKAFEQYLRKVYGLASTFSLSRELRQRPLKDMQPGDIFVYAAVDRSDNRPLGHAVMVVDVAQNPKTGKKCFLLAQGATPARNIHVMRNLMNPLRSPWFMLDEDAERPVYSVFGFKNNELRHF